MRILELVAAALFAVAVLHTFSTALFQRLAHRYPRHQGGFHLLGRGRGGVRLLGAGAGAVRVRDRRPRLGVEYIDSRKFTEPLFVFAIMVVAAAGRC